MGKDTEGRGERDNDFNGEKGERLFLPRIFFPSPSFFMIFTEKRQAVMYAPVFFV
jgi:hypothetical protein